MSETSDGVSVPAQAVDDVANAFDQMLPQTPTYIAIKPTRLTYKTPANTTQIIALARENKFHETIFQGLPPHFKQSGFMASQRDRDGLIRMRYDDS